MYTAVKSSIANAKEEFWERIQVDWYMLNFQFCLNIGLNHSGGFDIKSDVKLVGCQFSSLEYNKIIAHEKCSFHFLMFLDWDLIPAPYCGGINLKTWLHSGIQPVHVPLLSEVKL